jgi:hypothetical protein
LTFSSTIEDLAMNRSVALRAGVLFTILAVLFAATGLASEGRVAEVLFLISGAVCSLLLLFGLTAPAAAPVPIHVRRGR